MPFTLADAIALFIAVIACGAVLVAPGYALARAFRLSREPGPSDILTGVVVGLAVLPLVDSMAARSCGLDIALALNLALAAGAVMLAWRQPAPGRVSAIGFAFSIAWLVLLAAEWVDFDVGGRLFAPLTILDTVKHAATTQAIFDSGTPPRDAFFLRPERASYYYFYYTIAALVMRLCHGLVDAKSAVGGVAFWVGIGAYGLVRLALQRIGGDATIADRRRTVLIVIVLGAGGLDILTAFWLAAASHYWIADPLQWNEQGAAWLEDILWVPHHVTALIAGTVALVSLCDAIGSTNRTWATVARSVVLAALCFASCLGLSVWVTLAFLIAVSIWIAFLVIERQWRSVGLVVWSGVFALIAAAPQIVDLIKGRAGGGPFPIEPTVRFFTPVELLVTDAWRFPARLLTLPLNYAFEFGALAVGTLLYWRQRRVDIPPSGEFNRALTIAAVAGLLAGGFLRSTLFSNDLGWRALLLPLLASTIWTIAALDRLVTTPALDNPAAGRLGARILCSLIAIGWVTTIYAAIAMRAYGFVPTSSGAQFIAADPETQHDLRAAYVWARTHLPSTAVLQQDPSKRRAFAFGLYGTNPTSVSDSSGSLYGADPKAVAARIETLAPIFKTDLPLDDVTARAAASGVDDIVVTVADPIWAQPDSFVWRMTPAYASSRVRIIPVAKKILR